jgi:hypothetical protein
MSAFVFADGGFLESKIGTVMFVFSAKVVVADLFDFTHSP